MGSSSPEIFRRFVRSVFAAQSALLRHGDAANAPFGQTSARWRVLLYVSLGEISVARIAKSTGYSRQAVHRLADALIAEGALEAAPDLLDRRRQALALTPSGERVLRRMEKSFEGWSARLLEQLPAEELESLSAQLDRASRVVLDDCARLESELTGGSRNNLQAADNSKKGTDND